MDICLANAPPSGEVPKQRRLREAPMPEGIHVGPGGVPREQPPPGFLLLLLVRAPRHLPGAPPADPTSTDATQQLPGRLIATLSQARNGKL